MDIVISTDTNVWIDFSHVRRLSWPFKLPFTFVIEADTLATELRNPEELRRLGLVPTDINIQETLTAIRFAGQYRALSRYDCAALAIAYERRIPLLTGDGALRKTAEKLGVKVFGTIWILDRLSEYKLIEPEDMLMCFRDLKQANHGRVRLPDRVLDERIQHLSDFCRNRPF